MAANNSGGQSLTKEVSVAMHSSQSHKDQQQA